MAGYNRKQLIELLEKTEREQGFVEYFNVNNHGLDPVKTAGAWGIPMSPQTQPVPYVKTDEVEGFVMVNDREDYPLAQVYGKDAFTIDPELSHTEKPLTERLERDQREDQARIEAITKQRQEQQIQKDNWCRDIIDQMSFINSHFGEVFDIEKQRADAKENQDKFRRDNLFKKYILERYAGSFKKALEKIETIEGDLKSVADLTNIAEGHFLKDMVAIDAKLTERLAEVTLGYKLDVEYIDDRAEFVLKDRYGKDISRLPTYFDDRDGSDYGDENSTIRIFFLDDQLKAKNFGKEVEIEESPLFSLVQKIAGQAFMDSHNGSYYDPYEGDLEIVPMENVETGGLNQTLLSLPIVTQNISRWVKTREKEHGAKAPKAEVPTL